MVFPAIKAPLLRRVLMRIFAVLPGFLLWKKRIFDQLSVFWRSNFCIFQIFYFLTSRWFSQQLKLLCSVGFWCVFLQFCQVFCCEKKRIFDQISVFWRSNFCKFQILFSYKQMVFPAIKAPLLRRILMRIFAVLPGFLLWKKTYFRSDFCILKVKFLHISDLLFSHKQMVFPAIKAPLLRRILMRIFAVLPGFFAVKKTYFWSDFCILKVKFLHISDLLFSYKQMVFPAIKAPLLRRILMRIIAVLPGFFAVKKTYFWSAFCILKVKFLHISDLLFSYKQMVFPAIKSPLLRRILMRIFAVLPGFFAVKKKRIFDQISVFWRSNFLHISDLLFSYK